MKILIATGIYPPDIGGPATYSKLLADELPKHNLDAEVLSFGAVRHLPKIVRHFFYFLEILKSGRKADVIFAQDPVSVGLPSCLAAKILRKKFVLKIVGDYAWEQGSQRFGVKDSLDDFLDKKYCWQVEFLRKIQKFVAEKADIIITPSEYLKRIVSAWGIYPQKIKIIYNSVELPEPGYSKDEARQKLKLNGVVLLSAGRLVPWKGFDALIEIMPDLAKKISGLKLVIIGDGSEKENLESKIKNLGLEKRVLMTGKISHENLLLYLKAADIFVLNTGYEGLSHQLLEAMAVGIPVVTTDVGGNPEIIIKGKNGLLVGRNNKEDLRNAIVDLWDNDVLRDNFVKQARIDVQKFSPQIMISKTISLFNNL